MNFRVTGYAQRSPMRGLGDLVALVAEPVKRAGLRFGPAPCRKWLADCDCDGRRERLNHRLPFGRNLDLGGNER